MNAVYWGVTALCLMKRKEALDAEETIEYVMSCWDDGAGAHRSPITIPIPLPRAPRPAPRIGIAKPLKLHTQKRCLWRTPGTRRPHPFHAKRHPSPSDARCPLAHERALRGRLYVSPPIIYPDLQMTVLRSHPGSTTTLRRLLRRRLWRDRHAFPLLRRVRAIPPRRARPPRSRAHSLLPRLMPQL